MGNKDLKKPSQHLIIQKAKIVPIIILIKFSQFRLTLVQIEELSFLS